ncbi:MAG: ATP-binding protein [Acidimicrobiales bacterium]
MVPRATDVGSPAERDLEELARFCRHDLLEPIRTIAIGLDLLDAPDIDADERVTLAAYMQSSVRGLDAVARRLTEYLRLSTAQPRSLELADVVRTASAETAVRFPMVPLEIEAAPVRITADPILICDMFTELFDNAARHGANGPSRRLIVSHDLVDDDQRLRIIEPGAQDWADDASLIELFRAGRAGGTGGTGVGLAICRRICELHGGGLRLLSSPEGPGVEIRLAR